MEEKNQKPIYEKPYAYDLYDYKSGKGDCFGPGSGDVNSCSTGNTAGNMCTSNGNSADFCVINGNIAAIYCDITGIGF